MSSKLRILTLLTIGLLSGPMTARAQATYNVNFNGSTIDLFGTIQVSAFGLFNPTAFNANAVSYSITASNNGTAVFTFTNANSTWGGSFGADVSINALPGLLQLSAPTGSDFSGGNLFLLADAITNGARENLRIFNGNLGYRQPSPPDGVVFERVGEPFTLGTASTVVPEPGTVALLGAGLLALVVVRRRRS